ncbi:AlgP family protein [Pseudomonas lutea]|uniref:AlgP family protein n=1 Tax=Pseudomonas lutea TaxID=243924 RepID=A0ABR9A4U0_9PSED|nr:AlgP family protein [Pseudomonas lutea]MBD8121058.1 AlgP family protein [Pseudomonas lutea]
MASRKKTGSTPLQLLEELTTLLMEHFEQACGRALADAEKMLSRLEKKRTKLETKLGKKRSRLDTTPVGKRKKQAKLRTTIKALQAKVFEVQGRAEDTRQYIRDFKHDVQMSLALLQGVGRVREEASKMLRRRELGLSGSPASQTEVTATSASKPSPASLRAVKQATALKAIANAVVAKPTVTVVKGRKHAPSEIAPLAHGIAEASAAPEPDETPHAESALQPEWLERSL